MSPVLARLLKSTSSRNRPWQVALAAALGVMCGLLPKASVLFAVMAGIAFCLPMHWLAYLATTLIFAAAGDYVAAPAGRIGMWSLTASPARDFWMGIEGLPLIPWLGLHNTVVHGSLLIGLFFFIPSYVIALSVVQNVYGPSRSGRRRGAVPHEDRVTLQEPVPCIAPRNLESPEELEPMTFQPLLPPQEASQASSASVASQLEPATSAPSPSDSAACEEDDDVGQAAEQAEKRLADLVGASAAQSDSEFNSDDVLRRAQEMTAIMDELISTMDEPRPAPPQTAESVEQDAGELLRSEPAHLQGRVALGKTDRNAPIHSVSYAEGQHEESLRYLLQHLKECQGRVRREW